MKKAAQIIFRRLTAADFFNINKPRGAEARGGGQSYIDFPTSAVGAADWEAFFSAEKMMETESGPLWRFKINSLGIGKSQIAEIGRRRDASYNIRAQKLGTKASNRLFAWHPQYSGFPAPSDPNSRTGVKNLVIYLIRTTNKQYWAGWFQAATANVGWQVDARLAQMFTKQAGNIYLDPPVDFNEEDGIWAFRTGAAEVAGATSSALPKVGAVNTALESALLVSAGSTSKKQSHQFKEKTEDEVIAELFSDDLANATPAEKKQIIIKVLKRNQKIVGALKTLYGGHCQLTGDKFVFKKTDGKNYCEAHHLVALGNGGADSPYNLIIVSPMIHRMFHYADVSGLDLNKIADGKLKIEINGEPFTITWHPKHAELVNTAGKNDEEQI